MQVLNHQFECNAAPEWAQLFFFKCSIVVGLKWVTNGTSVDNNNFYLFKMLPRFPLHPQILLKGWRPCHWVFSKGIKRGPSKETFKFPPCSVIFAALPSLPDFGKVFRSSGLNVALAVDSQAHKESYIYGINDTLHPPHNSCLLHLVDWGCRPAPIHAAPRWKSQGSFWCIFSITIPGTSSDTPM